MTSYFSGSNIAQYIEQGPLNGVIPAYAALLSRQGYSKLSDFRGKMSQAKSSNPAAYERVQFMKYFGGKG